MNVSVDEPVSSSAQRCAGYIASDPSHPGHPGPELLSSGKTLQNLDRQRTHGRGLNCTVDPSDTFNIIIICHLVTFSDRVMADHSLTRQPLSSFERQGHTREIWVFDTNHIKNKRF